MSNSCEKICPEIIDIQKISEKKTAPVENLGKLILDGLCKPKGEQKSVPSLILWDKKGLDLYNDQVTFLEEYYVSGDETDIFRIHSDNIAQHVPNGAIIVELGAGSLLKTQILLDALDRKCQNITYYALDLMKNELEVSLMRLKKYKNVSTYGLCGSYDNGRDFLKSLPPNRPKVILWIGASMGNLTRAEAAQFLTSYNSCLNLGDFWIIGIDRRNDPQTILLAYDDPAGIQGKFCLNGLQNANTILGCPNFFNLTKFEYYIRYNCEGGRVESFFKSIVKHDLECVTENGTEVNIPLEKDELINFAFAHKYSRDEVVQLFKNADLGQIGSWTNSMERYDIHMAQKIEPNNSVNV